MSFKSLVLTLLSLTITSQTVYDFGEKDDSRWLTIHDTVMGGKSNGKVFRTENNSLLFQGDISLKNNGGFASFRSADRALTLPGSDGIEIKVLGDGRTYICSFERKGVNLFGGGYWQEFETRDGAWTVIRLPWEKFEPYSFGNKMKGKPALTAETAQSIGVYLYDKQAGPFRVEFDSFSVYSDDSGVSETIGGLVQEVAKDPKAKQVGLKGFLNQVVSEGVIEFNDGDTAACAARYRQALDAILALTQIDAEKASEVEIALILAEGQDSRDASWTLRKAIDSLRAS
jgi:NADH dehydrogenase [ubiquinone] 1 alpha subcomplex assembly factor 1